MLADPEAEPSDNLGEKHASAAVVTSKLSADGVEPEDYHDTLNGEKFCSWLSNRVLPAFAKLYPRKKMVLILDNAKYHHARGEDWITPSKMNRVELATYLRHIGMREFTSEAGVVYPTAKYSAEVKEKNGMAGGGPPLKDLRAVLTSYIKSHPGINTTLVQQIMKAKGHRLLYTPPYESWMQPIELVWARIKHQVAQQAKAGRSWQECAKQTATALSKLTPETCDNIIRHTEKLMDEWLQTPSAGSLRAHGSLDALSRLSPAMRERCTDLNLPDSLLTGDEEAEKENQEPDTE